MSRCELFGWKYQDEYRHLQIFIPGEKVVPLTVGTLYGWQGSLFWDCKFYKFTLDDALITRIVHMNYPKDVPAAMKMIESYFRLKGLI